MEGLKAALTSASTATARAKTVLEALMRSQAEGTASETRRAEFRRKLATALADEAAGETLAAGTIEGLRADLALCERDAGIRLEVQGELSLRLDRERERVQAAQSGVVNAFTVLSESEAAGFVAEARRALTPRLKRVAALLHAGGDASRLGVALQLASLIGLPLDADPVSADFKLAEQARAATNELAALVTSIDDAARERNRLAHAARERGAHAA